jgi:hypothetical protein
MKKGFQNIEPDSDKSEDEYDVVKQKQLPSWVQGKPIMGRVIKLSGFGWSTNNRVLRLTQHSLSYYSKVPVDFRD